MPEWFNRNGNVITLTLHVQPGAKRSEIAGLHGDALKIRLAAPPIDGKANKALTRYLSEVFQVPLRSIELQQGAQSRHKVIRILDSSISPEILLATADSK